MNATDGGRARSREVARRMFEDLASGRVVFVSLGAASDIMIRHDLRVNGLCGD